MKVTAKTYFLGKEGMWSEGESKDVSELRANELVNAGLVELGETEAAKVADVSSNPEPEEREKKPRKHKLEAK